MFVADQLIMLIVANHPYLACILKEYNCITSLRYLS